MIRRVLQVIVVRLLVTLRHVPRNSLIPIATLLGLLLPAVFAGELITESLDPRVRYVSQ
jgi:ABC-type dipeptide/oligopeptide/nickel transport system permease component